MELVADGLRIFEQKCPENLKALSDHLCQKFQEQIKLVEDFGVVVSYSVMRTNVSNLIVIVFSMLSDIICIYKLFQPGLVFSKRLLIC